MALRLRIDNNHRPTLSLALLVQLAHLPSLFDRLRDLAIQDTPELHNVETNAAAVHAYRRSRKQTSSEEMSGTSLMLACLSTASELAEVLRKFGFDAGKFAVDAGLGPDVGSSQTGSINMPTTESVAQVLAAYAERFASRPLDGKGLLWALLHTAEKADPGLMQRLSVAGLSSPASVADLLASQLERDTATESAPKQRARPHTKGSPPPAEEVQQAVSEPADSDATTSDEPQPQASPPDTTTDRAVPIRMLSDRPIERIADDRLQFAAYAEAIAGLINERRTSTPFTLAINARWGAGKSSLAQMIRELLRARARADGKRPHATCWFNAWMHDDASSLTSAFVAHVARCANEHRTWPTRLYRPLALSLVAPGRRARLRLFRWLLFDAAAVGVLFALASAWFWWTRESMAQFWPWLGETILGSAHEIAKAFKLDESKQADAAGVVVGLASITTLVKVGEWLFGAASAVGKYVADKQLLADSGSLADVRQQLGELISQATGGDRRFVIFIDDIERCRPPHGVELLEAINQLLDHEDVVTVVMADVSAVAAGVEIKYAELAKRTDTGVAGDYGRHYLQKIFQLQFDLPELHPQPQVDGFVASLLERETAPAPLDGAPSTGRRLAESLLTLCAFAWQPKQHVAIVLRQNLERWPRARPLVFALWLLVAPSLVVARYGLALVCGEAKRRSLHRSPQSRRWIGAASIFIVIAGASPFIMWFADRLSHPPTPQWPINSALMWIIATFSATFMLFGAGAMLRLTEWITRRALARRMAHEGEGAELADAERLIEDATANLRGTPFADFVDLALLDDVLRELQLRKLVEDSTLMAEAQAVAARHLGHVPRHLKRSNNRLRLLLFLAHRRGMFHADAIETARRLGKWVALQESWPKLAAAVARRPDLAAHLEQLAVMEDVSAFAVGLKSIAPEYAQDSALRRLFEEAPSLGAHMLRLLAFESNEPAVALPMSTPPSAPLRLA